jgi:hypothetical protein
VPADTARRDYCRTVAGLQRYWRSNKQHDITWQRKIKTAETEVNVNVFVNSFVDNEQKKADSFRLIELIREWSGFEPKMWGPTIIGFGSYHYKYASGHEGDAPLIGFSPRKAAFSLYVFSSNRGQQTFIGWLWKITRLAKPAFM